jgi:hypothetical protein
MSSTKKVKAKSTKKATATVRKGRKPVIFTPAPALIAAAKKEMARDDISNCAAVQNVAKKFSAAKRGELMAVFVGQHKMNKGTVARQIQQGRAAA